MRDVHDAHQRRAAGREARLSAAVAAEVARRTLVRCARRGERLASAAACRHPRGKKLEHVARSAQQPEVLPWKAAQRPHSRRRASYTPLPEQRRIDASRCPAAWPSAARRSPAGGAGAAHPRHRDPGRSRRRGDCGARSGRALRQPAPGADCAEPKPPRQAQEVGSSRLVAPGHAALQSDAEPRRRLLSALPRASLCPRRRLLAEPAQIVGRAADHRQHDERRVGVGWRAFTAVDHRFRQAPRAS